MKRLLLCTALAFAAAGSAVAPTAVAQMATERDVAAGRELRGRGLAAAQEGRWHDALDDFERSYAASGDHATLLHVAEAQAATGHLVAAIATYESFLDGARRRDARLVPGAREALAEVRRRLPRVVIRVRGLRGGDEVWLDDGVLEHDELETPRPIDPGAHTLTVARGGASAADRSFDVAEAGDTEVVVDVAEAAAVAGDPRLAPDAPGFEEGQGHDDDGGGVLASPWFWVGVGVVVAAGVAIPLAVSVGSSAPEDPYQGTLGAGVLTFR